MKIDYPVWTCCCGCDRIIIITCENSMVVDRRLLIDIRFRCLECKMEHVEHHMALLPEKISFEPEEGVQKFFEFKLKE